MTENNSNSAGFHNIFLNITIFFLSAIIIYLVYIFINNITGTTAEEKKEILQTYVPKEMLQVEVLNGCGISGLAEVFTDYLRAKNIDVVSSGNYDNFDVVESFIIDRIGNQQKAEYIADILGISKKKIITIVNENYFLDVAIILGQDYNKLKPYK